MKIVTIVVLTDVDHCNVHKDCNVYNDEEDISCEEFLYDGVRWCFYSFIHI